MSKLLKYARIERERRFLLAELPAQIDLAAGYQQLDDLYLEGTRLRLRSVRSPAGAVIEPKLNQKQQAPSSNAAHRIITSVSCSAARSPGCCSRRSSSTPRPSCARCRYPPSRTVR